MPVNVNVYVDDVLIDKVFVPNGIINWTHAPFGKFIHKVRLTGCCCHESKVFANDPYFFAKCDDLKTPPVGTQYLFDETKFNWCRDLTHYWANRQKDTQLLFNKRIKIGIDNSIGGTITQLYNEDRSFNLISESGGAAVQLSLFGFTGNDDVKNGVYGFACQPNDPVLNNVLNPIQASGKNCWFEDVASSPEDEQPGNDVDTKAFCGTSQDCWVITKLNPYNFTRAGQLPGMFWQQQVEIFPKGYAKVDYNFSYTGAANLSLNPQETPAIFLSLGTKPVVYWEGFKQPYGPLPRIWKETLSTPFSISVGLLAYDPVTRVMSKRWYSVCDQYENKCVTVVIGADAPTIAHQVNFELKEPGSVYASVMGYFALTTGFTGNRRIYLIPKRYDQIDASILGLS